MILARHSFLALIETNLPENYLLKAKIYVNT